MSHPLRREEDSIFIEKSKTKSKKKPVSLDPNPNSYPSKLPYPERGEKLEDTVIKTERNKGDGNSEEEIAIKTKGDHSFSRSNLLSDDDSHNFASEVISDHEPEQNESSITFSPRSDPLHHEFDHDVKPVKHFFIESLPISPIPVEDSEPTQEEIDILLVPDDLIPPGVEDADSEDEVNESPNHDHQDNPSIPRPPPDLWILRNVLNPKRVFCKLVSYILFIHMTSSLIPAMYK
ncbi:hypothetical protein Tco_0752790 [Tanacetum coccineum]|uniref:Uncharacterized protein n=1 Tax=Tanacetum coccineum TaxID=301880 RepID=A0ABQ4Z7W4_9ASTR